MSTARPILFSAPMVRALLEGRKTQTRRICKPQPRSVGDAWKPVPCPYGQPGNLLYVKEAWAQRLDRDHLNGTELYESGVREAWYWADGPGKCCRTGCAGAAGRYRHARFMPRWASRLTLRITDVRVEQLHDISDEDAIAEGWPYEGRRDVRLRDAYPIGWYSHLWESINGPGSWAANPWVWVLTFETIHRNVDAILKEDA